MSKHRHRRKMKIGMAPSHILLRLKPVDFHRLHQRAAENGRSLNFELNTMLTSVLDGEHKKSAFDSTS